MWNESEDEDVAQHSPPSQKGYGFVAALGATTALTGDGWVDDMAGCEAIGCEMRRCDGGTVRRDSATSGTEDYTSSVAA
jgi:hypothetical protein